MPAEIAPKVDFAAISDRGRVRDENQDEVAADPAIGFFALADGMGGQAAGAQASQLALHGMTAAIHRGAALDRAIVAGNEELARYLEDHPDDLGMGTTVVAACLDLPRYQLCWVGDSRAYLFAGGRLKRLTHDHSQVQHLIDEGLMTEEAAASHSERSVLARALQGKPLADDQISRRSGGLYREEMLLLCSDGLVERLSDDDLESVITSGRKPTDIAEQLVAAALEAGSGDNVSVIVVQPQIGPTRPRIARTAEIPALEKKKFAPRFGLAALVVMALAAVWWWMAGSSDKGIGGGQPLVPAPGPRGGAERAGADELGLETVLSGDDGAAVDSADNTEQEPKANEEKGKDDVETDI